MGNIFVANPDKRETWKKIDITLIVISSSNSNSSSILKNLIQHTASPSPFIIESWNVSSITCQSSALCCVVLCCVVLCCVVLCCVVLCCVVLCCVVLCCVVLCCVVLCCMHEVEISCSYKSKFNGVAGSRNFMRFFDKWKFQGCFEKY